VRRQHAGFFLALAEESEPKLEGAEQMVWLNRLETEHDNLRTAIGWTLDRERADAELGLRLAAALGTFWFMHGHWAEARQWFNRALEKVSAASTPVRAKVLCEAGLWQEKPDQAGPLFQESLALYRQLDPPGRRGIARALFWLGNVTADYEQAEALHEQSLALFQELDDKWNISNVLASLGGDAWKQGQYERALVLFEQSLALARETGDKWSVAAKLRSLGNVTLEQMDYERATALYDESLTLARELDDKEGIAGLLNSLGEMARLQGDYERAAAVYSEGLALRRELGTRFGVAMMLHNLGYVALHRGDGQQATSTQSIWN
jgi:tetratricopeptide (TPR) repeat protein